MNTERAELIAQIAAQDVELVIAKDASYGESWRQRGGIGAFMVTARKWDRIEQAAEQHKYDIFLAARRRFEDDEDLLAELRDLRCYLLLIESEIRLQQEGCNATGAWSCSLYRGHAGACRVESGRPRPVGPPNLEVREGKQPSPNPYSTGRTP